MNDEIFDDIAIENSCKAYFNTNLTIASVIVRAIPTGLSSRATIFTTKQGHTYAYIVAHGNQVLDDVHKMIHRMQCQADHYIPPHGDKDYFNRIGQAKFKAMFPGKHITSDDDLRYYKNLTPYNPALVRLAKVSGEIRAYEPHSKTWHKVKDYSYSKIKTA